MAENEGSFTLSKDMFYGIIVVILASLVVLSIFTQGFGIMKPQVTSNQSGANALSDSALKAKVVQYVDKNLLATQGITSEATSVSPYNDYLDTVKLNIKNGTQVLQSDIVVYISKDGQTLFIGGKLFNTSESLPQQPQAQPQQTANVQKSDKPKAQAFVMSFCPYGLQFLKAYIPVMENLGDKADLQVGFVSYAMHGKKELDANNYIYCAQKEEKAKLPTYLRCFVEAGDYSGCVATAGLDSAKITSCVAALDAQYNITNLYNDQSTWASGRFPLYPVQSAENQQYGVQGSPTFVLNGQQVEVDRTAEAIKEAVCAAFNTAPSECSQTLSSSAEAPGIGKVGSAPSGASSTSGGCGG